MSTGVELRIRRSLTDLQDDYKNGTKAPLENLMRAWKGIKELPPDDPRSFFIIGGYHGEPFRGAGWGSSAYWGGYCNHGNVLFPVWHRVYVNVLEAALRSIPGCSDVTMPFWDECSEDSRTNGIPWTLTDETFELDGVTIPNPLRSYKFQRNVVDNLSTDDPSNPAETSYSKPEGYETVRYPYSGLVGSATDKAKTITHNKQFPYPKAVGLLNKNIIAWLTHGIVITDKPIPSNVHKAFVDCLDAPNYTLFSNTTSAQEWNGNATKKVVPLEQPHNDIHLAVGGWDIPGNPDFSPIVYANGDMGENDTAGLDPIFFFHHCWIDRVFWLWQQRQQQTDRLEVMPEYPGTNSVDSQGPTPGVAPNSWLTMDSPLAPFMLEEAGARRPYTARDAVDVEGQLGYSYGPGSLMTEAETPPATAAPDSVGEPHVHVSGIDRGRIRGSFVIAAYAEVDGERKLIGVKSVLSRWHVEGCANCQTHLRAHAAFSLHGLDPDELGEDAIQVEVRTHDGLLGGGPQALRPLDGDARPRFRVELR
jgi:tyrosinase